MDASEPTQPRSPFTPEQRRALFAAVAAALHEDARIRVAWAFGSLARGEPFRDLDVGVWLERRPAWWEPGEIAAAVWAAIGKPPFQVDVVALNDATAAFRLSVADQGVLLTEREAGDAMDLRTVAASEEIDRREWLRVHGIVA